MADRELKRCAGKFLDEPRVGDVVVNANRKTTVIPRYEITKVNEKSVRMRGLDTHLDFVVTLTNIGLRCQFRKV